MVWIAIILLVVAAFAIPRLGRVLLRSSAFVLALSVIGAVVLFVMDRQYQAERELAKTLIEAGEIELVDLALRNGYAVGSYTLVGRVRNRSARHALMELRLKLTMKDCTEANTCEIVGQSDEAIYVTVPPGQARDLDEYVSFAGLGSPRGKHQWTYEVQEVVGR